MRTAFGVQTDPAVGAYLATLSEPHRDLLAGVCADLLRLVPDGSEAVSYGMPGVRVDDEVLLWSAGWTRHCPIYPVSVEFKGDYAEALAGFGGSRNSIQFTPDRPLPPGLLAEFVTSRRHAPR